METKYIKHNTWNEKLRLKTLYDSLGRQLIKEYEL